jgi:two-component system, chemotaxis family, sensor kinase CheA
MNDTTKNPTLIDPDMKEIVDSFIVESKEILDKLDVDLMELEKRPKDAELLNQIFRSFHTIKGTSGFLGLERLPHVTHQCEDILNKLRKGEATLSADLMEGIILGYDTIKELVQSIEVNQNEDVDITSVGNVLESLITSLETGSKKEEPIKKELPKVEIPQAPTVPINSSVSNIEVVIPASEVNKTNVKAEEKPEPQEDKQVTEEIKHLKQEISSKNAATSQTQKDNTIRVDINRLDALLDIVSELVLGRNRLSEVSMKFSIDEEGNKYSKDFSEVTKQIDLMTTELQNVSMKLRMIKIGKIFNRYPRMVRDLCKEIGKDIELVIRGEETEIDKNLIEEINDPLVHLIRNSVDHGVEKPDVRIKAGKNPKGTVILSAEHLGNNIVISIEDDGKGMDPEVLREKAVSKGLISREKAKELTRQEVINLIFLPGFSTAEVVSNVSGRGVGMDVVKTNVSRLRGIINVESEVGKGTKIVIKLPLTLAIIPGMIVKAMGQTLVVPLASVIEVLRVHTEQIRSVNGREVIQLRDSILPLVGLEQLLKGKLDLYQYGNGVWQYVVEVGVAEKRYGIKVDGLVGQQEVVIKSLGSYLGKIDGIAGSTITGDGSVQMILDIHELFNRLEQQA